MRVVDFRLRITNVLLVLIILIWVFYFVEQTDIASLLSIECEAVTLFTFESIFGRWHQFYESGYTDQESVCDHAFYGRGSFHKGERKGSV